MAKTPDIILTGGCSTVNHRASNRAFRLNTEDGGYAFGRVAGMLEGRYGHAQIYSNGYVFVIGGFNHEDEAGQQPSTLQSVEKFSPVGGPGADNVWT